jgi:hypothetical protein
MRHCLDVVLQVDDGGTEVTLYVSALEPKTGALQSTCTWRLPALAVTSRGAVGISTVRLGEAPTRVGVGRTVMKLKMTIIAMTMANALDLHGGSRAAMIPERCPTL